MTSEEDEDGFVFFQHACEILLMSHTQKLNYPSATAESTPVITVEMPSKLQLWSIREAQHRHVS